MFGKVLSAACLAAVCAAAPALAQLREPAEVPPSSYKGQQYVDSAGCVFLRAGFGGKVTWVPRVTRDRKQLCGYPPSGAPVAPTEMAGAASAAPAPAPNPTLAPAPADTAMAAAEPAPKPVAKTTAKAKAKPRAGVETVRLVPEAPPPGADLRLACPADTPVAQRLKLRGGGSKVMCTRGDGSLDGASLPILVDGSLDGVPVGYAAWAADGGAASGEVTATAGAGAGAVDKTSDKLPAGVPPPGYKLAWTDDRLNPNRGKQTVDGVYQQDEVWTRTVPAELREDWQKPKPPLTVIVRHRDGSTSEHEGVVVSTKSDGRRVVQIGEASAGRLMVQVGTFGVPSNAEGAAGRLGALGLPVARGSLKGGALTVVYAGPFASAAEAGAALAAARKAGFSDAMIVR
ncbi:SPOR domain-containing protein [Rhodobacter sp. Har01]|uniref:SPOR domain-containing protein n=1 Tax=Rhodobacter sp. Har01 TaxID=2883999 RepID=UPI001D07F4D4|nr:SPOR domain-containing protein [Rhodobacter sp. Har01]MCB6178191.1 SPOR domain-containing protein [Rhodobacter sp. Har01]